ncbi:MAG: hypothetical protein ACOYOV_03890 [Bacteroidales bacterium]
MTDELNFKTDSSFKSVTYDKDADSWYFVFSDNIVFNTQTIWRLLDNRKIKLVSLDNGHQFGLTEPIDLVEKLNEILIGKHLLEIKVKQNTADLQLTLTDNLQIEILITSSGYESYQFLLEKKNYIGMGSGEISIYENKV